MKKIVLALDSFKGSISSLELCDIGKSIITSIDPKVKVVSIPIADGGEGTIDAISEAIEGEKIYLKSKDLNQNEIDSYYYRSGSMAIIEMANCAGLHLSERNNPLNTTTIGVGIQIKDAIEKGAKKIILGLGGSGTNDGGCGCACGLGMKFYNQQGEQFLPTGINLHEISYIDDTDCKMLLENVEIIGLCDVNNPLYGKAGAAYVFAPQKGADQYMVKVLDENLKYFAKLIEEKWNRDISFVEGSGAAGGMGASVIGLLGGTLKKGIDTILDITNFENKIKGADIILTGEGRVDNQSIMGKVVGGVGNFAQKQNVPVIVICGIVGEGYEVVYDYGVVGVFVTNKRALPFEEAKKRVYLDVERTFYDIFKILTKT